MNSSYFKNTDTLIDSNTIVRVAKASISKIRNSLLRETWLPLGLRSIVAKEIGSIDEILNNEPPNIQMLAQQVHHFVNALDVYKDFHEKSEVIGLVKILYLMMQNFLEPHREGLGSPSIADTSEALELKKAV